MLMTEKVKTEVELIKLILDEESSTDKEKLHYTKIIIERLLNEH